MPLSRLVPLIIGIIIILGLMLWLIDAIGRLYWQLSYSSPLLGTLMVLLLVVLLGVLIWALVYYLVLFSQPQRTRKSGKTYKAPEAKAEAAVETLKAVRQQVDQIQDEVARQVLIERSQEIETTLRAGDLRVVVFGTGSAGKTSLINALLGRVVGKVSAPMGTTDIGQTYTLPLKGLNQDILITDTPGILEAGLAGTEREQRAKQLATAADLLVFVVDNDLRQSEYEPMRMLARIGKRSLLVLNKTDLYPEGDREVILASLRERVRGFIHHQDIVAVAAHPQPLPLENGELYYPPSDVLPLIRRLAAILRAEGEELIADNILLQANALGEEARRLIDTQRRRQADKVVERYQWIGAGAISVTPLPVLDLLATAAVNAQMVVEIGKVYGCELNLERGRELALSLAKTLASLGIVEGAMKLLTTALQLNIATFAIAKVIQGVTAAYLTRIAGKSFIEYFRQDQDWGDGGITEVVQRQFQLNKRDEFLQGFLQDAIAKIVRPFSDPEDPLPIVPQPPQPPAKIDITDDWSGSQPPNQDW